jgi:hypothetical protein
MQDTRSDAKRPMTTADIAGAQDDERADRAEAGEQPQPTRERPAEPARADAAEAAPTRDPDTTPLFDAAVTSELRDHWTDVQSAFVDEPRSAVEQADALVADVMKRLAAGFADERKSLETQWSRGDDVSTEDLRLALQRYRSFFDRLLSV